MTSAIAPPPSVSGGTPTPLATVNGVVHGAPPPPRLVIRVGVTGHRAHRLADADVSLLRSRIATVLRDVRSAVQRVQREHDEDYAAAEPRCRLVSALAEGSDQLVADLALDAGYELQCPLPFARAEYARDFTTDASRSAFFSLLDRATAVLELDGSRADGSAAYEHVGRVMTWQSDLVIAIWDGDAAHGRGGTAQIVNEAVVAGIPVLWIDARPPHSCVLITAGENGTVTRDCPSALVAEQVQQLVTPEREDDARVRTAYFDDTVRRPSALALFRRFVALVTLGAAPYPRTRASPDGHDDAMPADPRTGLEMDAPELQREYRWADELAGHYGSYYRDSFVGIYLMGALAVLAGLLGDRYSWAVVVELLLLATVITITLRGRRDCWHTRWLNFRLLAEELRSAELVRPVGRVLPSFRVPPYATDADPSRLWVSWLARARVREAGMASARVDSSYGAAYGRELAARLAEQVRYHEGAAWRGHVLAHRLHVAGIGLFAIALVACVLHLGTDVWEAMHTSADERGARTIVRLSTSPALTLLDAVLPAIGAALAAIASQGEFGRIAERSHAMVLRLRALLARLRATEPPTSVTSGEIAEEAAETMTAELLDWQITFRDKPLHLPT